MKWWERWPDRLERELAALDEAGIGWRRDEEAFERGLLHLELEAPLGPDKIRLLALFPASYPFLRLELFAPDLSLPHHQNPFGKNLCIFGQDSGEWHPSDTLYSILAERLPLVVEAGSAGVNAEQARVIEEPQAEPASFYFDYAPNAAILIDSEWDLGRAARGSLDLLIEPDSWPLRGAVVGIRAEGNVIVRHHDAFGKVAGTNAVRVQGKWARVTDLPKSGDAHGMLELLVAAHPDLARPSWQQTGGPLVDITAVIHPEETGWRKAGEGWTFVVRRNDRGRRVAGPPMYLVRGARAGPLDLAPRVPALTQLRGKVVAIAGLGALGAPSAIELAKSGVGHLRLLDYDYVEAGTVVRWPLGLTAAGMRKTDAVGGYISANYPYTEVLKWDHRFGHVQRAHDELEVIDRLLDGADVLLDATAEIGVQHLLSDAARQKGITYICMSATAGAWGGMIATIPASSADACWMCLQYSIEDRTISIPPVDPTGRVQPAGCASPTFTGTGYDLLTVATIGVRSVIAHLLEPAAANTAVITVGIHSSEHQLAPPTYSAASLQVHASCTQHGT